MALIDPEGDMFIGMSDMRILEHITPDWLEGQKDALRKADAIVCDPCLTPEALEWITSDALAGVRSFPTRFPQRMPVVLPRLPESSTA